MTYSSKLRDSSSKKGGRSVSVVLALIAIMVVAGAYGWLQNRNAPIPTTVDIAVISGEATVTRSDAGSAPPLKAGEKATLQRGDQIQTGPEARARLTFSGGETTELYDEARVTLLELQESPMTRALVAVLALHEGKTLTRIRHALFRGMRFEIETPVATVQARGTVFQCDVLDKSHIYVGVYDGIVNVSMGEQSVELEAGQGLDAHLGQPLIPTNVSQPIPADAGEASAVAPDASATLTDREKTLFPPVLTPTRPGDDAQFYTVQSGDTLYSIARKFGLSWEDVWQANKDTLHSPEVIRVGQRLRIPR